MLLLNWGLSQARIWLDDLPDWNYKETEIIEHHLATVVHKQPINSSCAIELFTPIGGRFYYGALAVTFTPTLTERDQLIIQLPLLDSEQQPLHNALSYKMEAVFIGLLHEYAEGILTGITHSATDQLLTAGTLRVCGAAHGEIGSSRWMFTLLSRICIQLLHVERDSLSEKQLIGLIQEEWTQTRKNP